MSSYGLVGGVLLSALAYVELAPMLGYSEMVPKLIIASGFIMSGDQLGTLIGTGKTNSAVVSAFAIALGVGVMILVQPAVADLVSNQILQALLLGPACAIVVGLAVVALAEAVLGAAYLAE